MIAIVMASCWRPRSYWAYYSSRARRAERVAPKIQKFPTAGLSSHIIFAISLIIQEQKKRTHHPVVVVAVIACLKENFR